jgi:two-component system cell cycle response regulator DivK
VDGAEGLSAVARFKPDLVLLDIQLPVIDGYEVARRLKADPKTRDVPIIAVTSYALTGDEEKARSSGCDAYVAKPFGAKHLLATIRQFLPGEGAVG